MGVGMFRIHMVPLCVPLAAILVSCQDAAPPTGRDESARPELDYARSVVMDAAENGRSVADEDRTDATDNSNIGIIGRLQSVDRVLDVLVVRMDAISASFQVPPDDSKPAFRDVLAQVQERAQYVYDVAAFLLACGEADRPPPIAAAGATVAEADRTDSEDTSTEGLLGRLGSVSNVLGALAKRMEDIDAAAAGICVVHGEAWASSPGLEVLASIQGGALDVVRVAEEMLTQFGTLPDDGRSP